MSPEPAPASHWVADDRSIIRSIAGPPGIVFFLATALAAVVALDAASGWAFLSLMAALAIWGVLGLIWVIRLFAALTQSTDPDLAGWIRWLGVPTIGFMVVAAGASGTATQVRFDLSRGAMDRLADDVAAGLVDDHDGWVGAFPVMGAEAWDGSVRIYTRGGFLTITGFERFDDPGHGGRAAYDCACTSQALGGGWWAFTEDF
jgi:hypothetical protein